VRNARLPSVELFEKIQGRIGRNPINAETIPEKPKLLPPILSTSKCLSAQPMVDKRKGKSIRIKANIK
jgi:hypothetical protein